MSVRFAMTVVLGSMLVVGCLPQIPQQGGQSQTETETETETETTEKSALELTWVSGHLGSYWDCPDQGMQLANTSGGNGKAAAPAGDAPAGAPAEPGEAWAGDCAEGEDCGGWLMNCEDAQLTFVISNVGDAMAEDMEITDFELLDADLAPITGLEILSITRTDGHEYNGQLHAGEEMTVRVHFRGPVTQGGWGDLHEAAVRVIMVTGDDADAELVSPALQTLPAVAT